MQSIASAEAPEKTSAVEPTSAPVQILARSEVSDLLAYYQTLRELSLPELAKELATLNTHPKHPALALRKSMVLSLSRNGADTTRALALAESVAKSTDPDAISLKSLAQMLTAQNLELRRLTEQAEKSAQQVKESQRRIEQLNDTLEALKAIERTLPTRSAPNLIGPQSK